MNEFGNYLLTVLGEFGSGRGDPADEYVRFGLGTLFFGALFVISMRNRMGKQAGRETYLAIGFGFGLAREAFKFVIKSLEVGGGVETASLELFFPPLEHALFAVSRVFIAAGFIYYLLDASRLARWFAIVGTTLICGYYLIVAPIWWSLVAETPTIKFSHVRADWVIHWFGTGLGLFVLGVFLSTKNKSRILASLAFTAFALDDILQLVNLGTGEVYKSVFAPIRHNLHIWAIAILGFVYLREHTLERQRLEKALHCEIAAKEKQTAKMVEGQAQLNAAVRIAGIGYFSFDSRTGNCTHCSEQHAAHLGLSAQDFIERTSSSEPELFYVHQDDRQIVLDALDRISAGEHQTFEYRAVHPNGAIRFIREIEEPVFDDDGIVVANVGTSIDLTEQQETEARLRQSQRIEVMGTLTGGVAHDFNNLLAVIMGNLELLRDDLDRDELVELVDNSIGATLRGAELTRNMLSFARQARLEPKKIDLNEILTDIEKWAGRTIPATIDVEMNLSDALWEIHADPSSTESALLNLILNARDAMPDGGKLTLETANQQVDEPIVDGCGCALAAGKYVVLTVRDTGIGIEQGVLAQIFQPFYTTKPIGKGSGLGLSMTEGFMKQSGGELLVFSEPDIGTTFELFFPVNDTELSSEAEQHGTTNNAISLGLRILVVEDEPKVLSVIWKILTRAGYDVTTASSGDEALRIFEEKPAFELVLTDIVMPGELQGASLAKALRLLDPVLPIIFMSGYAEKKPFDENSSAPKGVRLMKPVSRSELLTKIEQTLRTPQ